MWEKSNAYSNPRSSKLSFPSAGSKRDFHNLGEFERNSSALVVNHQTSYIIMVNFICYFLNFVNRLMVLLQAQL